MTVANGEAGIRDTLRAMSHITKAFKKSPVIRELALKLVSSLPQKKWFSEARKIHAFVRDRIRYVKDIRGVETLQTPVQTLRIGQGDCDDHSILIASLLEAIGHKTRFLAIGFTPQKFTHVFPQVNISNQWITLEATEKWKMGRGPKNIKSMLTQHN